MNKGTWRASVRGEANSRTRLSNYHSLTQKSSFLLKSGSSVSLENASSPGNTGLCAPKQLSTRTAVQRPVCQSPPLPTALHMPTFFWDCSPRSKDRWGSLVGPPLSLSDPAHHLSQHSPPALTRPHPVRGSKSSAQWSCRSCNMHTTSQLWALAEEMNLSAHVPDPHPGSSSSCFRPQLQHSLLGKGPLAYSGHFLPWAPMRCSSHTPITLCHNFLFLDYLPTLCG